MAPTVAGPLPEAGIGLDLGSTLAKIAVAGPDGLTLTAVPSADEAAVRAAVEAAGDVPLGLTGARASVWAGRLADRVPTIVDEFLAAGSGAQALLRRAGESVPADFLLACVGTGTSVVHVTADAAERIGGTALGGGTFLGLGQLLCRTDNFAELVELAAQGNRQNVDLLLRDVYPEGVDEMTGGFTAANFGRVNSTAPADLAQALCGLLGENLGFICGGLARAHRAKSLYYCGATLPENWPLTGVLLATTAFAGVPAALVPDGAHCGAVGALVRAGCQPAHGA